MKIVAFDKTGTLTVGKPVVMSAVLFSGFSMQEFCDMTTAAEVSRAYLEFYFGMKTFVF